MLDQGFTRILYILPTFQVSTVASYVFITLVFAVTDCLYHHLPLPISFVLWHIPVQCGLLVLPMLVSSPPLQFRLEIFSYVTTVVFTHISAVTIRLYRHFIELASVALLCF